MIQFFIQRARLLNKTAHQGILQDGVTIHIHTFTTGSSPNLQYRRFSIRDDRYKLIDNPYRHENHLAKSRYVNSRLAGDQLLKSSQSPLKPPELTSLGDPQH